MFSSQSATPGIPPRHRAASLLILAAGLLLSSSYTVFGATTVAVGNYDSTGNANAVDRYAGATGTLTGSLTVVSDVAGYNAFTARVSAAHAANRGGVITFDDIASSATSFNVLDVSYGTSTMQITGTANSLYVDMTQASAIQASPISGAQYLRSNGASATHYLNFATPLSEVGFTVLARNAARTINVEVTFDDLSKATLNGVAVPSSSGQYTGVSPSTNNVTGDVFYGLTAPTGRTITSLVLTPVTSGEFFVLDDLAFVAVPEPSHAFLLSTGLAALALRRRRGVRDA